MSNTEDPDQTAPKEQSDQGLHCLLGHFDPNAFSNYNIYLY